MNKTNLNNFAISEEMYIWLEENLPEGSTILEFGSGTGTIELTKKYNVYSVEQSKEFIGLAPLSNYIYAPLVGGWYDTDIVFKNLPKDYDLLLIDGPGGSNYRNNISKYWDKFNLEVPIIFDDTHRQSELSFAKKTAQLLERELEIIPGHQKSFGLLR
ncbi:hypothetical protein N9P60_00710 [bacterium]|nr:hypothetical protein [bacterium]MDB4319762.1 hypothetical protein [bacterium]MDB9992574.1 hypothetical protein [bacterium]|tara:strand:+ start:30 stop:503 length:474 start_codon:yes stop_codon:yes gene_type:complete